MSHYTGPCSDCGRIMSTHPEATIAKGTAFTDSRQTTKEAGSVYLVCEDDIKKREAKPDLDCAPGKVHLPGKIEVRP